VLRLLFGWMAMVCCQVLLFAWWDRLVKSDHQIQSQRGYLPSLELSTNQAKQQTSTLHIGTHILSESSKDNTKNHPRYQLTSRGLLLT
jgi:hypothetical protein